jgi:hypothetical protein
VSGALGIGDVSDDAESNVEGVLVKVRCADNGDGKMALVLVLGLNGRSRQRKQAVGVDSLRVVVWIGRA